ncbi:MAG: hypothetical protein SFH39_16315 [Candidatus Magnetobacterium sp. LHC-1]|nr:hypothetical protein [Nitrospirota bacterium]
MSLITTVRDLILILSNRNGEDRVVIDTPNGYYDFVDEAVLTGNVKPGIILLQVLGLSEICAEDVFSQGSENEDLS